MNERQKFLLLLALFAAAYFVPFNDHRVQAAIIEAFMMLREYAREHVLLCLIPAFFIAGAIANFVTQSSVLKYFGGSAKKYLAYSVASVSGTVLAVCSCTVLPLFAGIYKRGAGIGPAVTFLYSGPAINILAVILTARVLGWQLGLARALGAVLLSVVIGVLMSYICRREEAERAKAAINVPQEEQPRTLAQNGVFFLLLVLFLVFASWGRPEEAGTLWAFVYNIKWYVLGLLLIGLLFILNKWFSAEERKDWVASTWSFAVQILPLLFAGVLFAGLLMGRPGSDAGLIPSTYISALVGGNSLTANLIASVIGSLMYFATLTEVPILQGLVGSGMGQGPALALLLSGPALSLPNMLVIRSVLGIKKTLIFIGLVVVMSTVSGLIYGSFF